MKPILIVASMLLTACDIGDPAPTPPRQEEKIEHVKVSIRTNAWKIEDYSKCPPMAVAWLKDKSGKSYSCYLYVKRCSEYRLFDAYAGRDPIHRKNGTLDFDAEPSDEMLVFSGTVAKYADGSQSTKIDPCTASAR